MKRWKLFSNLVYLCAIVARECHSGRSARSSLRGDPSDDELASLLRHTDEDRLMSNYITDTSLLATMIGRWEREGKDYLPIWRTFQTLAEVMTLSEITFDTVSHLIDRLDEITAYATERGELLYLSEIHRWKAWILWKAELVDDCIEFLDRSERLAKKLDAKLFLNNTQQMREELNLKQARGN